MKKIILVAILALIVSACASSNTKSETLKKSPCAEDATTTDQSE